MKRMLALVIFALGGLAFVPDSEEVLIPGIGIEGGVMIKVSTLNDIRAKYGSDYYYTEHVQLWTVNPFVSSVERNYQSQGVSFIFEPGNDTCFSMSVRPPFKGKTQKGIVLGQSTLLDVKAAYGNAEVREAGGLMFVDYPGIRFCVNTEPGLSQSQVMTQTISVISIWKSE